MSFILEALRKAERERELRTASKPHSLAPQAPARVARAWPVVAALLLNAGLLGALLVPRYFNRPPETDQGKAVTPEAPAPEPPERIERAAAERVPAAPKTAAPRPRAVAPLLEPSAPRSGPKSSRDGRPPVAATSPPAFDAPAPGSAPDRGAEIPPLPRFEQMPPEVQAAVPDLKLNLIAYATDPGQRLVYIKNRRYLEGEIVEGAYRVETIRREGVVLSHRGERFVLMP